MKFNSPISQNSEIHGISSLKSRLFFFSFILVECTADWQFQCNDKKKCIDKRRRCDGYAECADKSDEADCLDCNYQKYLLKK